MLADQHLRRVLRSDANVAMYGDLTRALVAAGVIVLLWFFSVYYASLATRMFTELQMNDFGRFYYSARAFLEGRDMYGPTPATLFRGSDGAHLWNMNPPHFHLLVLPLALLPPLPALLIWAAVNLLALVISLRIIARTLQIRWTWTRALWTLVAVVLCSATGIIVVTGQLTFLLMLPVTLAWRDAREGRWRRAAILLGVVISLKPFLAVVGLYFLVARRFAELAWMAAAGAAAMLVGAGVFGWQEYAAWIQVLGRVDWMWAPMNASVYGLVARAFTVNLLFTPIVDAPAVVRPLFAIVSVALLVATLVVLAVDRSTSAVDRGFAATLLLSLLVSPLGWMYYLWLAAGPLVALSRQVDLTRVRAPGVVLLAAVPGLLLPIYATILWRSHPWGGVSLGSTYTWTVLALWAFTLLMSRRAA